MKAKEILSVDELKFGQYGVFLGERFKELCLTAQKKIKIPENDTAYEPSASALEAYSKEFCEIYGGMPVQVGYCAGQNTRLNAVEYHKGSEIIIAATPLILLLGLVFDIKNFSYDSSLMSAFEMKAGQAVELFGTTLHYAPIKTQESGFCAVIVLPKETNTPIKKPKNPIGEERLLTMRNKWLIAHPESSEAKNGAFIGITGENIEL